MEPDEAVDKSRKDLLNRISAAEQEGNSANASSGLSVTPLVGRLEKNSLSGIGPAATVSLPLLGNSEVRKLVELRNKVSGDRARFRLLELSGSDWDQVVEEEILKKTYRAVGQTLATLGINEQEFADPLRIESERSNALSRIYLSSTENPPLPKDALESLSRVEEELSSSVQSVTGKTRPWWKKMVPTRLNITVEPLSLGRSLSPFGAGGLEFYRGSKVKLEDQALFLSKAVLELKTARENGVKELFLALTNLRDFPKYNGQLAVTLSEARTKNEPIWEIVEELNALTSKKYRAEFTAKTWSGVLPEVSKQSDAELLTLADKLVRTSLKTNLPRIGELKEVLEEKVAKLKSRQKEAFDSALKELLTLEAPIQLGLGNDSLKRAAKTIISGIPTVSTEIATQFAQSAGRSQAPMAPTMEQDSLAGMLTLETSIPALNKNQLRGEYRKIRKQVGELSAQVIEERDKVDAGILNGRKTAALHAKANLPQGSLYVNRAERARLEAERSLPFLPTANDDLAKTDVSEPKLFLALYKQAEIEAALLKKGDKETVISSMIQGNSQDKHAFVSLDLSSFTEKPIKGLFRKIFRRGPQEGEILGERNKEIVGLKAAERFLKVEMDREKLLASLYKKQSIAELGNPEDLRSLKSIELQAERANREYEVWEEFIRTAPPGLKEPLEKVLNRESGRELPISSAIKRHQGETLRIFYDRNIGSTDLTTGVFGGWNKMGNMNRGGVSLGLSFQPRGEQLRDAQYLSGIEQFEGQAIREEAAWILRKGQAQVRAANLLGAARVFRELKDGSKDSIFKSSLERQAIKFEEQAEGLVRDVALSLNGIEPRTIGSRVQTAIDLPKLLETSGKFYPSQTVPGRTGAVQLKALSARTFAGDRFQGGAVSLGSIEVGGSRRKSENKLILAEEELQELERSLGVQRLKSTLTTIEAQIRTQDEALQRVEKRFWLLRLAATEGDDSERARILSSTVDTVQSYFALRGQAESDALTLHFYNSQ